MARFSHVSGSPVLDLVNTIHWRLDPEHQIEEIDSFADVLDWCAESALITDSERRTLGNEAVSHRERARQEHLAVLGIREAAYAALFEAGDDAVADLTEGYRRATAEANLTRYGDTFAWTDLELTLATPRHRIMRDLVDLLTHGDLDRLHQCEDRACGWVYLDTSPRRNRRWCVASDCGDRNRARAYYARNKNAPT